MAFVFTIALFAFAHSLKLSINPNAYTSHHKNCGRLQYHKAANIGRERAQKAQMRLFDYTGFAMLTYTIKQGMAGFEPVGEEELAGKMTSGNEIMLLFAIKMAMQRLSQSPCEWNKEKKFSKGCLQTVCKSSMARSRQCHRGYNMLI